MSIMLLTRKYRHSSKKQFNRTIPKSKLKRRLEKITVGKFLAKRQLRTLMPGVEGGLDAESYKYKEVAAKTKVGILQTKIQFNTLISQRLPDCVQVPFLVGLPSISHFSFAFYNYKSFSF
ncbi:hypothetical protein PIB30_056746 [Stylosanthes scabra]|uniref:Uncharacterized protein n=1 Tax=Stylosanthes scabra TaxID=79078 RepID=A0ABU6QLA5_9FABA|nr:hypothetical protein [Stylosanthes scabra]